MSKNTLRIVLKLFKYDFKKNTIFLKIEGFSGVLNVIVVKFAYHHASACFVSSPTPFRKMW